LKQSVKFLTLILLSAVTIFISSCDKKTEEVPEGTNNKEFSWRPELKISDIPDTPVKSSIGGIEVQIKYINFEQWRGSGDNVLNFGDIVPKNDCGYVEDDNSFHLIHKSGELKAGELLKVAFDKNLDGYSGYYESSKDGDQESKKSIPWNCALVITEIGEITIKGKIAMCFKDDKKSWIAGTFEAIRCSN